MTGGCSRVRRIACGAIVAGALGCAGLPGLPGLPSRSAPSTEEPTVGAPYSASAEPLAGEYEIGPNDLLKVSVWRQPEITLESVVVRPDGRISVPLLDDVTAAGRTPEELKLDITTRLAEYVREPSVTVVVLESRSQRVYVTGEVARKGVIPLAPGMRIFDALAVAGGLGPFADGKRILILRERQSSAKEFTFDYNAYVEGKKVEQNILLESGDRIVVPESSISSILR